MFQVDANHPTPLYAQLERSIRFAIATGKLGIGDQLPTVRQLAVDLRINANTVAKVYAEWKRAAASARSLASSLKRRRSVGAIAKSICANWRTISLPKRTRAAFPSTM